MFKSCLSFDDFCHGGFDVRHMFDCFIDRFILKCEFRILHLTFTVSMYRETSSIVLQVSVSS